jgi:hypothetical protein
VLHLLGLGAARDAYRRRLVDDIAVLGCEGCRHRQLRPIGNRAAEIPARRERREWTLRERQFECADRLVWDRSERGACDPRLFVDERSECRSIVMP